MNAESQDLTPENLCSPQSQGNIISDVIIDKGLIVIETPKYLDTRPLSLVITSKLSSGGELGDFSIPAVQRSLYVEGQKPIEQLQKIISASDLPTKHEKIEFFSFASINATKETQTEEDIFLSHVKGPGLVEEKIRDKGVDVVIINNLAQVSNYFLTGSEKNVLTFIRNTKRIGTALIVLVESGTKGLVVLKSMADLILTVTEIKTHVDAPIRVEFTKIPAYQIDRPQPFCLSLSSDKDGKWWVTPLEDSNKTLNLIIDMACYGTMTQEEIGTAVGLQQYQVSRILARAEEDGLIVKKGRHITRAKSKQ